MRQTWRWFGPQDLVSVDDMLQAGVEGVVSALHHVPSGMVWIPEEIEKRQRDIATMKDGTPSGLAWEVVESLPVSEEIKKQNGVWRAHLDNYRTSLRNLAAAGIEIVCYNFMPVLDWTRTDLAWRRPTGATCMRFDFADFAAFDLHVSGGIFVHWALQTTRFTSCAREHFVGSRARPCAPKMHSSANREVHLGLVGQVLQANFCGSIAAQQKK